MTQVENILGIIKMIFVMIAKALSIVSGTIIDCRNRLNPPDPRSVHMFLTSCRGDRFGDRTTCAKTAGRDVDPPDHSR